MQFTKASNGTISNFGPAVALTGGTAVLAARSLAAGSYSIAAVYSGDANFSGSSANGVPLVVTGLSTKTSIGGIPATVTSITPITPSATISTVGSTGNLTGTVQFTGVNGGTTLNLGAAAAVTNGTAVGARFYLPGNAAVWSVIATYSGDAIFAPSSATAASVSTFVPTTIAFTPAPATTQPSAMIALSATVSGLSAQVPTSGTVKFMNGSALLGSATMAANGLATTTVTLAPGVNALSATFTGDGASTGSSTASVNVTVPTFTLTAATPSLTLASANSASGTDVVTLASASGFAGNVALGCAVTFSGGAAAVPPGCSVSPASVSYPATTQATVTLMTSAPHSQAGTLTTLAEDGRNGFVEFGFAGLLCLCLPVLRRRNGWRAFAAMVLLMGALAALSGCGGKGSPPVPTGGTTTGAYTVTITGTSSTGIPAVSTTFSLNVN